MAVSIQAYTLIDNERDLEEFYQQNQAVDWLCFDTEFVGEKRFVTLLCLIQVATEHGFYLIDPLKLKNIDPLLRLIQDENIIKITHAGDNDYRLLHGLYGILPKNVFDTQIAAGFVGYKYPISFRKLMESELSIRLSKGYAVTDWESRPFSRKQLKYALDDVIHLYELWKSLEKKLIKEERLSWAEEEFAVLEEADYYKKNPNKEALNSSMIKALNRREQVFLIRLYRWRIKVASEKNYSKEMVLPSKMIGQIVKSIHSGKDALKYNRRIPDKISQRYGDIFMDLYKKPTTEEEKAVLKEIPNDYVDNPKQDLLLEMLNLLIRYRCLESGISPNLVLPRTIVKRLKADDDFNEPLLEDSWRRIFLGEDFITWLKHRDQLEIEMSNGKIALTLNR